MIFYYMTGTCSLASHIALEHVGVDYEARKIDFRNNQQRSKEYLAVNPKGRVPALVTDAGIITENPAILYYIAQTHPNAGIAPLDDAGELAQVMAFNAYLSSTVHVAHAHGARPYRWADDEEAMTEMKRKMPQVMTDCFSMIEESMLVGPWVRGDQYTICDMYLFTIAQWLEGDNVDIEQFPKVNALRERMRADETVQRTMALQ